MNRILLGLFLGIVLVFGVVMRVHSQTPKPSNNIQDFMRVKLNHAQNALEGLTLEDYDKIRVSSQGLSLLSLESTWQVFETPKYNQQSSDFRRAADRLSKAATEKNLDGATLAYVELTTKCVNCHKYVRNARRENK